MRALQAELQGRAPHLQALVEAAVAQERAQQETRNLRVLDLLRSKVCGYWHGITDACNFHPSWRIDGIEGISSGYRWTLGPAMQPKLTLVI